MKPKFVGGKHKTQTEMEPVIDLNKDLHTVLFQILVDLKEKQNEELRKTLGIGWKELEYANMKFAGNKLELQVSLLDGSLREPKKNPIELQKKLKETYDVLHRFEDAVKKEFKKRTNRALVWVSPKESGDFEFIALNGLCRFYAIKFGEIKTKLDGQDLYGE